MNSACAHGPGRKWDVVQIFWCTYFLWMLFLSWRTGRSWRIYMLWVAVFFFDLFRILSVGMIYVLLILFIFLFVFRWRWNWFRHQVSRLGNFDVESFSSWTFKIFCAFVLFEDFFPVIVLFASNFTCLNGVLICKIKKKEEKKIR